MLSRPFELIRIDRGLMTQGYLEAFRSEDLEFFRSRFAESPNLPFAIFESGNTLAHYAVLGGCNQVLSLLYQSGALVDHINGFGQLPLHLAASLCNRQALEILWDSGVQFDRRDGEGDTILHRLANYFLGRYDYVDCELDWSQRPPLIRWILERFPSLLELRNKAGQTPLGDAFACATWTANAEDTLRALLDEGADPNVRDPDGNTLAHLWGSEGNMRSEPIEIALKYGLNLSLKNDKRQTALDCLLQYYTHRKPPEDRVALLSLPSLAPTQAQDFCV